MLSLERLPNEVLHSIASFLLKKYDLAAFSQVNRLCYHIASPILWKREVTSDRPGAIHWAVENGDLNVLDRALAAGVDPSRLAYLHKPKPRIDPRAKWWNYHSTYYEDLEWRIDDDAASVDLDPTFLFHDHCNCFDGCCDSGMIEDCSWEPIHIAAAKGRVDMIDKLLEKGANIDGGSWGYCLCQPHLPLEAFSQSRVINLQELEDLHGGSWTPLHVAICHGQVEAAKFLLSRGASTHVYQGIELEILPPPWQVEGGLPNPETFKVTALHDAAAHNHPDLLQFIVDGKYQEDIDIEAPYTGTPLLQAIWYGHWDTTVPWLLKNGANIDARLAETRLTPLMMACFSRRFDDAAKLVDLGANVTILSVHQFSILHLILGPVQRDEDDPFDSDEEDTVDKPPAKTSTVTEAELIRKFIAKGFPVDTREALLGMTPLMVASASCNVDAMKALLDGGANVNALDHDGLTALSRVGEAADGPGIAALLDAGRLLLDAGATIKDAREDLTALHIICSRRQDLSVSLDWEEQHAKLAQLFIERGADPNDKGVAPSRPVTEAIVSGNYILAEALLQSGGRPEPNDIQEILESSSRQMFDSGKTLFLAGLDYAEYELKRPSDAFFVRLIRTALSNQFWTRAADLMQAVPVPKEMRAGLIHRCLQESDRNQDDPSTLVLALVELGEDPNELYKGEPAIFYSLGSHYGFASTPILLGAGADVCMATPKMPDGAFMHAIRQGCQGQALQIVAKYRDIMKDKPESFHRECWESIIRWGTHSRPGSSRRGESSQVPFLYWNLAKRLMEAGLEADLTFADGSDVKSVVEEAVPTSYALGAVERQVLEMLGITYVEPSGSSDDDDDEVDPLDLYDDTDDENLHLIGMLSDEEFGWEAEWEDGWEDEEYDDDD